MSTNSSALVGKRVLITRPAHQSHEFADALRAAGAEPIFAPTIKLAPPDDPAAAAQAVYNAAQNAWVVFTSANGVHAFFDMLRARREDARAFGSAKIAAIGIRTAQALRAYNVYADLVPQSYIAESLAHALISASKPGDAILLYRAQEARDVLPQRLREAGREPQVVAAYKTEFVEDPDFGNKVSRTDIITFTSASTVSGFSHNLSGSPAAGNAASEKLVACIGPITAQRARELGIHVDVVATEFTSHGLLIALERFLSAA
jgi:uroporphyrinogen III methyltransferase / synthase